MREAPGVKEIDMDRTAEDHKAGRGPILVRAGLAVLLASLGTAWNSIATAQAYPAKPIKLIVAYPPGGANDILGRIMAQKLSEGLGQQVVVDNRGGAGGTIGSEAAAKSPGDGYTLLMGATGPLTIAPSIYPKLGYDAEKSFAPISLIANGAYVVVVHPSVPANSLKELISLARSKPGQLNFGSAGFGNPLHIAGEMFKLTAGVNIVHVPFQGGGPATKALLAGQVQMMIVVLADVEQFIRAGRLRALAVASPRRLAQLPDVPTAAESGLPNYEVITWFGLVAPRGTPGDVIKRLNAEVLKALAATDVRKIISSQGLEPVGNSPEQFSTLISEDKAKWARVVKASGAKID